MNCATWLHGGLCTATECRVVELACRMSATLPRSLRLGQLSALPPPSCSLIFSLALYCLRAGRGRDMRPPWSSPPKLHGRLVSLLRLFLKPHQPRLLLPTFAPHLPIELFRRLRPSSSQPPAPPSRLQLACVAGPPWVISDQAECLSGYAWTP